MFLGLLQEDLPSTCLSFISLAIPSGWQVVISVLIVVVFALCGVSLLSSIHWAEFHKLRDQDLADHRERLRKLSTTAAALNSSLSIQELLQSIADHARIISGASCVSIGLSNEDQSVARTVVLSTDDKELINNEFMVMGIDLAALEFPVGNHSLLASIAENNIPWISSDPKVFFSSVFPDNIGAEIQRSSKAKRIVVVPLSVEGKQSIGFMFYAFAGEMCDVDLLVLFGNQGAQAIEKFRMVDEVRQYSTNLEEIIERKTRELNTTENQLSDFLQNMSDLALALDPDGRIVFTNRMFETFAGGDVTPGPGY